MSLTWTCFRRIQVLKNIKMHIDNINWISKITAIWKLFQGMGVFERIAILVAALNLVNIGVLYGRLGQI